ncbi:MAG: hypothetical protein LEGION0398_MBIBDBAK_00050 [Legionellaceae bacterium]
MKYSNSILALLLTLMINPVYAKVMQPMLVLESIKSIKATEETGDEIYLNITSYLPNGKTHSINKPLSPSAWSTKNLSQLKDLSLWSHPLAEGEAADIILTLAEQDNPPFDPDDLLGVVQLKLMNTKQGLKILWSVKEGLLKKDIKQLNDKTVQKMLLTGSNGAYELTIKLVDKLPKK